MRADGCIFVDTPKECSFVSDNKCVGVSPHRLQCLFNHIHLEVHPSMEEELVSLFLSEIHNEARYKKKSGLAGRIGGESNHG